MNKLWLLIILVLSSLVLPSATLAQQRGPIKESAKANELFKKAELALVNIEFEEAGKLAKQALETGALSNAKESSRARYLVGVGLSSAGNAALAKEWFRSALTIDPEMPADSSLGPTIQSPFLEARAELAVAKVYLSAEVGVEEGGVGPVVAVTVDDPARVAKAADVSLRPVIYESNEKREYGSATGKLERYETKIPLSEFGLKDQTWASLRSSYQSRGSRRDELIP